MIYRIHKGAVYAFRNARHFRRFKATGSYSLVRGCYGIENWIRTAMTWHPTARMLARKVLGWTLPPLQPQPPTLTYWR